MSETTYHAFMLDHATASLPPALLVAGDLHVSLSASGAGTAALWDAVGGALLESAASRDMAATARRSPWRSLQRPQAPILLARDLDRLSWRRGLSGVRHSRAGVRSGAFMRLEPGQAVPKHNHSALEATVVLRGALRDDGKVYEPGDLALGIPGEFHQPQAEGDEPCICFVARGPRPFWRLS